MGCSCYFSLAWLPIFGLLYFILSLAGAFDAISGIEMINYLSGPKLGDTEAGLVAAAFGITFSIVSGGILCIVGVGACCYLLPKFVRYHSKY